MVQDLTRQVIERKHVGECSTGGAAINICIDNLVSGKQEMSNFLRSEYDVDLASAEISVQESGHFGNILFFHRAKSRDLQVSIDLMHLDKACHRHLSWQRCEAHFDKLLRVEITMPVQGSRERSWDGGAGGIDSLPHVADIDTTCNFLDQHRCQALSTKFLVDAQEVDLSSLDCLTIQVHLDGNASDHTKELVVLSTANSDQPRGLAIGWAKGPSQEGDRVVKAEHGIIILDVILHKQVIDFLGDIIIHQV